MKKNNMKCVVMTFGQYIKIGLKEFFSPSKTDHIFDDKEELFAYLFSIIGSSVITVGLYFFIRWLKIEFLFSMMVIVIGMLVTAILIICLFIWLWNSWQKAIKDCWDKFI